MNMAEAEQASDKAGTHARRAHAALDRLLARVLKPDYTGTAAVELVVKQGGVTAVRLRGEEQA